MITYTCINCGATKAFTDADALKSVTCKCGTKGIVPELPKRTAVIPPETSKLQVARSKAEWLAREKEAKTSQNIVDDDTSGILPRAISAHDLEQSKLAARTARATEKVIASLRSVVLLLLFLLVVTCWNGCGATHWEYMIVTPSDAEFETKMDVYGSLGWEMITARRATNDIGTAKYEVIMKRKKF